MSHPQQTLETLESHTAPNHERAFQRLWLGSGLSQYSQATLNLALPLFALNLHANSTWMGLLNAAKWFPWLLVGLVAGVWVDRLPAGVVLVSAALVAACTLLLMSAAQMTGMLHLSLLLFATLILGVTEVFTQAGRTKLVAQLTPGPLLEGRNAKLFGTEAALQVLGQGSAGPVTQWFGQLAGFLLGSLGYLLSALALWRLPVTPAKTTSLPVKSAPLLAEIAQGWRVVYHDPVLRIMTLIGGLSNFGIVGMGSLFFLYMRSTLHLDASEISLAMLLGSLGGILGAVLAPRLGARFGNGRANTTLLMMEGFSALLIGWPDQRQELGLTILGIALLLFSATSGNVLRASWRQRYVPAGVIGRVTTSSALLNYGLMPLGALLGGELGQQYGVRPAILLMAGLFLLSSLSILLTRIGWIKHLPERPTQAGTTTPPANTTDAPR